MVQRFEVHNCKSIYSEKNVSRLSCPNQSILKTKIAPHLSSRILLILEPITENNLSSLPRKTITRNSALL